MFRLTITLFLFLFLFFAKHRSTMGHIGWRTQLWYWLIATVVVGLVIELFFRPLQTYNLYNLTWWFFPIFSWRTNTHWFGLYATWWASCIIARIRQWTLLLHLYWLNANFTWVYRGTTFGVVLIYFGVLMLGICCRRLQDWWQSYGADFGLSFIKTLFR